VIIYPILIIYLGLLLFFCFDNYGMYESIKFWEAVTQSLVALCMIGIMFMFVLTIHYIMGVIDPRLFGVVLLG
jgi:hypothetical protein